MRYKSKLLNLSVLAFLTALSVIGQYVFAADLVLNNTPAQVCFSPRGGCTDAITNQINAAKSEILIQAYSFTSSPIAKALTNAHKRGIKIEVILDKSQRSERYSSATFLLNAGVPTYIDDKHATVHNKIMIIDRETIITGSFNFTKAGEECREYIDHKEQGTGEDISGKLAETQRALGEI